MNKTINFINNTAGSWQVKSQKGVSIDVGSFRDFYFKGAGLIYYSHE